MHGAAKATTRGFIAERDLERTTTNRTVPATIVASKALSAAGGPILEVFLGL